MKNKFLLFGFLCVALLSGCEKFGADDKFMRDIKLTKLTDYLYEVYYDSYDYDVAQKYNNERFKLGACSSVRNGNFHGRNYDWYYDENVEFVVHTSATENRHASVGVAAIVPGLDAEFVASGKYSDSYKLLPFRTVDGINDAGVVININVVPFGDKGKTIGTNPEFQDLFIVTVVRYVLDYADSVDDAVRLLKERNIYAADIDDVQEEVHFMISDKDKTVVVEFVDNKIQVVENANIMTNFYLSTDLTAHAAGLERYNILRKNYENGANKDGMLNLMKSVWYTNAYDRNTTPFWYSEFSHDYTSDGYVDLTKDSPTSDYEFIVDKAVSLFDNRARDSKTWQTVHTSVYDLENKTLTIVPQEGNEKFEFKI
ncbi:MAG: carcinine hydrolase/isopenicillin-N N-acyltransferase family protein [Alphaproteobacteria bacterium]